MPRLRLRTGLAAALVAAWLAACAPAPESSPPSSSAAGPSTPPVATTRPDPGHELFGYLPYWEVDDGIAAHLRSTPLTTLALFSVTTNGLGAVNTGQPGYRAIAGPVGERVIREAHERGVRVELVFTSFGLERNRRFFADGMRQDATIAALVQLAGDLGLDGVNVDVESLDPLLLPAWAAFVGRLRESVVAADAADQVSVATQANAGGAAMAAAAVTAGADRIFLMGYDYRTAGSSPGASAPLERRDGDEKDLAWSLDLYAALGVPADRTILGLPLYGVTWPVAGPLVGAPETGRGETWIPRRNLDVIGDPAIVPVRDEIEQVEVYFLGSDGSTGPPSPATGPSPDVSPATRPSPSGSPAADRTWRAVYVDSPATLEAKLALANERGLAGAGFWAIGYERGLAGYTDLMSRFGAGEAME